ncbi:MAG: pilus assembly protein PilZ [Legionellales bacterium]|nr:pilus assembly protein PilZ [Legionellales bacterium]
MSPATTPDQPPASATFGDGGDVFFVNIQDKTSLFRLYMPFISNGALFVKTDKLFNLGDEVFLLIKLIDEPEKYTIHGRVAWITPLCAQGALVPGIGVQFGEDSTELRAKIETYLAGGLTADRPTDTM